MSRTIITIETDDKIWLEQKSRQSKQSMAELIRKAIGEMRKREESHFKALLDQTAGIWKHGDGLQYQQDIRGEWER